MGLSQLHQLRGRVGQTRDRGYAYFLYPKGEVLTETSYDRLSTIAANNDLGAGMAVAMKDLEMRGAGNVLGGEQSGHISGVGFDLYVRLVGEAVEAFRPDGRWPTVDGREEEKKEIRVDLPVDAHIPPEYVASERLRLEAYRKFAEVRLRTDVLKVLEAPRPLRRAARGGHSPGICVPSTHAVPRSARGRSGPSWHQDQLQPHRAAGLGTGASQASIPRRELPRDHQGCADSRAEGRLRNAGRAPAR